MEANQVGMYEICIWPDGEWIMRDEYSEEEWKWSGDDFRVVQVPVILEAHDINNLIQRGEL